LSIAGLIIVDYFRDICRLLVDIQIWLKSRLFTFPVKLLSIDLEYRLLVNFFWDICQVLVDIRADFEVDSWFISSQLLVDFVLFRSSSCLITHPCSTAACLNAVFPLHTQWSLLLFPRFRANTLKLQIINSPRKASHKGITYTLSGDHSPKIIQLTEGSKRSRDCNKSPEQFRPHPCFES